MLPIHLPTLPEQQKIADFLSAVDARIGQLTRQKALLEQYKKGVMQKVFSQEIRFQDDEGKALPDWEEKRLGEVCQINPQTKELPESFIYIDLESVENGSLLKENKIDRRDAPSRAQRLLQNDDIIFQLVRPYQQNNLFFDKGKGYVASTGYAQLRTVLVAPRFLYQIIHTNNFLQSVLEKCTGSNYPAINSNDLALINLPLPSLPEQQKIAAFFTALDEKIGRVGLQLERMQAWKKGLLQRMFV